MTAVAREVVIVGHIEVLRLSDCEWRVTNLAEQASGSGRMGFVALVDDGYEVTRLAEPGRPVRFSDLKLAAAFIAGH